MRAILVFILFLLTATSVCSEPIRSITVQGKSSLVVPADFSKIHAQLRVVSKNMEESRSTVEKNMSQLVENLGDLGVSKEDIVASTITQGIEYRWENNVRSINGYFCAGTLQIKIMAMENIYKVYEELAKYPALSVNGTEYGKNNREQIEQHVLQQALVNAREKAKKLAATLDAQLGSVLTIRETGSLPIGGPEPLMATEAMRAAPLPTVGSVTIDGEVVAQFELK